MNKKVKTVLTVLLLLIPTYLAIFAYSRAQTAPVELRAISKAEITAPNGTVYTCEKADAEGLDALEFLTGVNERAQSVSEVPATAESVPLFTVLYHSYNKTTTYKYYVGADPSAAYMTDDKGKSYRLTSADASAFTDQPFAESLYPESVKPVLTIGEETVVPAEYEWHYNLFSGKRRDCTADVTKDKKSYPINSRLEMAFNVKPDVFTVVITADGKELFHDDYANIANLAITESRDLDFHVEAKWYEITGVQGDGSAVYDFTARVNTPPSFYATYVGESFVPGDFFMITAKDITTGAITFKSEPEIGYSPTFVPDGDYYRALVPISYELNPGHYVFTLESDGVSQTIQLDVAAKLFKNVDYQIDNSIVAATRTETTLAKFESTMGPVAKSLEIGNGAMFYGRFGEGVSSEFQVRTGVGAIRSINGGTKYRHQGCDYIVPAGTEITAVNDGKVIYVGTTDLSGNIVVIEHGLGLKSWYCHMSEISVEVGQEVKLGEKLGVAGKTGFTDQISAHVGLSVFDVPVSPYNLWENELEFIEP